MTMTAQSVSVSSGVPRFPSPSKPSSVDSAKTKRARTKHACDECRRSQKKCDGDRPLCRRCFLNGTQCTYTPHKSRNQCPSSGHNEEPHGDVSSQDMFVFAEPTLSSFYSWSATSSPDQSPSTLETLSPTNVCQEDRFGKAQDAVYENQKISYESGFTTTPAMTQRSHHLYTYRSTPLASSASSSSASPPLHATDLSSFPVSMLRNLSEQTSTSPELEEWPTTLPIAHENMHCGTTNSLPICADQREYCLNHTRRGSDYATFFDISSQYRPPLTTAYVKHQQQSAAVLSPEIIRLRSSVGPMHTTSQYEADRNGQDSFGLVASLMPTNYVSDISPPGSLRAPWLIQGRADGVYSAYSYAGMNPEVRVASHEHECNAGINTDVMFISPMGGVSTISNTTTQDSGHNVASLPSNPGRHNAGMTLLNLPRFAYNQVGSDLASPINGSYPSSTSQSPSSYGTSDFYDWAQ